jgi:hypothetical protein
VDNRILVLADDFFGENGEAASRFSELFLCREPEHSVQFVLPGPFNISLEKLFQRASADIIGKQAGHIIIGLGLVELRKALDAQKVFDNYMLLIQELLSKTKAFLYLVNIPESAFNEASLQVSLWNELLKTISHPRVFLFDFATSVQDFVQQQHHKGKFARSLYTKDSTPTSLCYMKLGLFIQEQLLNTMKEKL